MVVSLHLHPLKQHSVSLSIRLNSEEGKKKFQYFIMSQALHLCHSKIILFSIFS